MKEKNIRFSQKIISAFGKYKIGSKGQFFSPDLMVAVGVMIIMLAFFFVSSGQVFTQTSTMDERKEVEEISNAVANSLVLSAGAPANWHEGIVEDANAIGLARSNNEINSEKAIKFIDSLNDPDAYEVLTEKLGLGAYELKVEFVGSEGEVINDGTSLSGGIIANNPSMKVVIERIVDYGGASAVMRQTVSK